MRRTWVDNRWFTHIPTHYIIDKRWNTVQVNPDTMIVGAVAKDKYNTREQMLDANRNGIHVELVWDFNKHHPTQEQYDAVNNLYRSLISKYGDMQVKWHKDFQSKNCPWKNFDFSKIKKTEKKMFSLSRYYSPMPWQSRYYNWKTYEEDVTMNCWASAIGNNWCLYPANSMLLKNEHKWKVVACPPEYPLWTKIHLSWIWVVTCVDRWWAIKWNRIDMYCWVWEWALDNRSTCPTWKREGYIVE